MHRSFWLEQALASTNDDPNPLRGDLTSDIAIVGGGFVGLWTALMIKRRNPAVDVCIVEADLCGRRSVRPLRRLRHDVVAENRQLDDAIGCRRGLAAGAGFRSCDR